MNHPKYDLGAGLRSARAAKNVSQEEAADEIGMSRSALQGWEQGESVPKSIGCLISAASYYGVTLDELVRIERD